MVEARTAVVGREEEAGVVVEGSWRDSSEEERTNALKDTPMNT